MNTADPATFTTPEVNGTFNSWCGNCAAMTDADGDNIWEITIDIANGAYEFITIQPGPYPYPNRGIEWRPMHIHFSVFGKSFGQRLITQMYFEGDPLINLCPMINSIEDEKAKNSLVGILDTSRSNTQNILSYKFDIVLRGLKQTYFENRLEGL